MKLFWFDRPGGNFGDDLNPWLWPRLIPGLLDDDPSTWFVGIGTLLNERLPPTGRLVVLGAGAGLGRTPRPDARWSIYGVRGPMTATALGLAPDLVLTDPAAAVARFVHPAPAPARTGIGFMPHYASLAFWDWRATAQALGLVFIDPCAPVDTTLATIAGLESLLTEAMHGAIVADALRTPWVAVAIDPGFHAPKWRDWGGSLGLAPAIHHLPALADGRPSAPGSALADRTKRALLRAGLGHRRFTPPPPPRSPRRTIAAAHSRLEWLAATAPRQLSDPEQLEAALARLDAALASLKADHATGRFTPSKLTAAPPGPR